MTMESAEFDRLLTFYAESSPPGDPARTLARIIARLGFATETELEARREAYESALSRDPALSFAQYLLATGALSPQHLAEALREWKESPRERLGKYRLLREVGRGGMGVVYEAEDTELGRRVAVKTLRESDDELVARLRREARIAARLRHPNIVVVHEVGRDAASHFIVMEFVEGRTLQSLIAEHRTPREVLLRMIADVARAAGAAHAAGVVHRDLKPANVLVEASGRVVLTDFGLARAETADTRLTQSRAVLGTPCYMAPEQVEGRTHAIDSRTDVYALGVMLYEALAGRLPFDGDTPVHVMCSIVQDEPRPLRARDPTVAMDLQTIVMKCLEKDPGRRYARADDVADDVARFLAGEPIGAHAPGMLYRLRKRIARRRALYGTAAGSAALLVAILAILLPMLLRTQHALVANMRRTTDAYVEAALACRRAGDLPGMREYAPKVDDVCREVSAKLPALAEPHFLRGRMLRALMRFDEALAQQEEALRKEPACAPARYERALLLLRRHRDRVEALYAAWRRRESARAQGLPGLAAAADPPLADVEDDDARALRRRALDDLRGLPGHAAAALRLIAELARLDRDVLRRAIAERGRDEDLQEWLVRAHLGADDLDEAARVSAEAVERDRGFLPFHHMRVVTLIGVSKRAFVSSGHEPPFAQAVAACDRALELDPGAARFLTLRAEIRHLEAAWRGRRGDDPRPAAEAALADADEALRRNPSDRAAIFLRASMNSDLGLWMASRGIDAVERLEQSIADFARVAEGPADDWVHGSMAQSLVALAQHHEERGVPSDELFERAVAALSGAIEQQARDGVSWARRGYARSEWAWRRLQRTLDPEPLLRDALADFDEAIRLGPPLFWLMQGRGQCRARWAQALLQRGADPGDLIQEALRDLNAAVESSGGDPYARLARAQAHRTLADWTAEQGRDPDPPYAAAVRDLDETLSVRPESCEARLWRANTHAAWGTAQMHRGQDPAHQFDCATADFAETIRLRPHGDEAFGNRGFVRTAWIWMLRRARPPDPARIARLYELAIADFAEAIRLRPRDASHWSRRGRCRWIMEDWAQAVADYEKALELDPSLKGEIGPMLAEARSHAPKKER